MDDSNKLVEDIINADNQSLNEGEINEQEIEKIIDETLNQKSEKQRNSIENASAHQRSSSKNRLSFERKYSSQI